MAKRYGVTSKRLVRLRRARDEKPAARQSGARQSGATRQPGTDQGEAHLARLQRSLGNAAVQRLLDADHTQPIARPDSPRIQRQPAGQKGALSDYLAQNRPTGQQLWTMHFFDTALGLSFTEQSAISGAQEYEELAENLRRQDEARRSGSPVPASVAEAIQNNKAAFLGHVKDVRMWIGKLNGKRLRAAIEKALWKFLNLVSPARTLRLLMRKGEVVAKIKAFFARVRQRTRNIRDYARRWS